VDLEWISVDLGSIWGRFSVDLGSIWGRFSVDLGSILCRFGVDSLSIWGRFSVDLGSIWGPLVCKGFLNVFPFAIIFWVDFCGFGVDWSGFLWVGVDLEWAADGFAAISKVKVVEFEAI
jgi:hypothetical protein